MRAFVLFLPFVDPLKRNRKFIARMSLFNHRFRIELIVTRVNRPFCNLQVFTGVPMSVFSVLLLTLAINTWGKAMYSLDDVPEYFKNNVTVS